MRTVTVVYLDGHTFTGRAVPFDDVLFERHFKMPQARLYMQIQAKTAKLQAEGKSEEQAQLEAMADEYRTEYEWFRAYCVAKRLNEHRGQDFDEWGTEVESLKWEDPESDPLDDSETTGSTDEKQP